MLRLRLQAFVFLVWLCYAASISSATNTENTDLLHIRTVLEQSGALPWTPGELVVSADAVPTPLDLHRRVFGEVRRIPEIAGWKADWPLRWLAADAMKVEKNAADAVSADTEEDGDGTRNKCERDAGRPAFLDGGVGGPVVIRKAKAVASWPALREGSTSRWSPERIATLWQPTFGSQEPLENVYRHSRQVFGPYWDDDRPMAKLPSVQWHNAHELLHNMSMQELVAEIDGSLTEERSSRKQAFFYFASNVGVVGTGVLRDISPLDPLELDPDSDAQNSNFWIGQSDTVADLHYDAYENFMVQVTGQKRWLLLPPYSRVSAYPFAHPSHAQSQIALHSFGSSVQDLQAAWPELKNMSAFEVDLFPGDVLYLPSCWWHHVHAFGGASICVNAWSFGLQNELLRLVFPEGRSPLVALGKQHGWNRPQMIAGMRIAVALIVGGWTSHDFTAGKASILAATSMIFNIWSQRYSRLVNSGEIESASSLKAHEPSSFVHVNNGCLRDLQDQGLFGSRKGVKRVRKDLQPFAQQIVVELNRLPMNVQRLWLENVIEFIAFDAVASDPSLLGPLFELCAR